MRKQYYFRQSTRGLLAWDVDRLVTLSKHLPRRLVPLKQIPELDQEWSGDDERPTWRALVTHMHLIHDADLTSPIIVSAEGAVMDGRHRVAKDSQSTCLMTMSRRNAISPGRYLTAMKTGGETSRS
jgi:hypothetical protein